MPFVRVLRVDPEAEWLDISRWAVENIMVLIGEPRQRTMLMTEDPDLSLLLSKASSSTVDPELSGLCISILSLIVYYDRALASDELIRCLVDQSTDPKAKPHLHLLDRAVCELLAKRIGMPDTFLQGQSVYYGAACLLRRGAAIARTAGKTNARPELVAWASKIPFFGTLLALITVGGVAAFCLAWLMLPLYFADPSRSLATEVESTIWLYVLVLLALFAIFAIWANNDRPYAAAVHQEPPLLVEPEGGWPVGEEPVRPKLCGLWRYTRPNGQRAMSWHTVVALAEVLVEAMQFHAYTLGWLPRLPLFGALLRPSLGDFGASPRDPKSTHQPGCFA